MTIPSSIGGGGLCPQIPAFVIVNTPLQFSRSAPVVVDVSRDSFIVLKYIMM